MKSKWYGAKILIKIDSDLRRRLELAAKYVEGQAIKNISSGPTQAVDSSRLKNSITHETLETSARVGTNVRYAKWVEMGTVKMPPRPFLRLALINSMDKIILIMTKAKI